LRERERERDISKSYHHLKYNDFVIEKSVMYQQMCDAVVLVVEEK
jgi:hypothetical protein